MSSKPTCVPAYFIMLLSLVLDQLTKTLVRVNMDLYERIYLLEKFFDDTFMLIHVENTGAAFSLGLGSDIVNRIFFITVTCLTILFIIYLLRKTDHRLQVVGFGFVL
ncbi:MAG TPA: signal peptidase II, partial [Candidatus Cloacimonas sp.]|nr:signal peptidase II [Candidatus Cloacimonas sp.]